ncbi:MAG: aldehyde ferredoxin oxidoreductase family protein [Anaerolineae bacterium]|jgi:aldehyde:ferredoxin oxidoreductase
MIGGTYGKILHVDLTSGDIRVEHPGDDFYRLLVGGRAVISYLLLRDLPAGTDPLSPENLFIVAPGIMQGTNLPGSGRHGIGGKAPLTGALGNPDVGGFFGHEFKRAGLDALVVHGRADSPVYLWINDGEVELRSAGHLWGKRTAPVQATIREELGDDRIRVAQIGPAGENRVLYANVIHDVNRAAGRNGMGAVMGSKNLKAIAVRGTMDLPILDRAAMRDVTKWLRENYKDRMAWATAGIGRGTQDSLMNWGYRGGLPTRNFSKPVFENRHLLSGERNYEMYLKERDTCQACPVRCKQVFENESEDPYRRLDPVYGGAEYEAMGALGSCCGMEDNLAVLKANELANAYGLDVISAGMSIAFVMECFEKGILTSQDTGGLEYSWGSVDALLRSIEMIANREGFGDVMADGVARMSEWFGPETKPFALTIKGQELPMHEPRLKHAMGIGYALSPTGADHMINIHDTDFAGEGWMLDRVNAVLDEKLDPLPPDELSEEKMQIFYHEVNFMHFMDCAMTCFFYCYDYHHLAETLSGVTGEAYTVQDILDVGARAATLARMFNLREGFTAEDDRLPKRVMEPFSEGPIAGSGITEEELSWFIHRYYELMGWDRDTGEPTDECLRELGLDGLLA